MTITTVGIDLAKNVFAVHGVDQNGRTVLIKSRVTRAALPGLIAGLPPCVIGMEACSGAHYQARLFRQYGHEPRLMAAKFVSPYRMAGSAVCTFAASQLKPLRTSVMVATRQSPDIILSDESDYDQTDLAGRLHLTATIPL